MNSTQTNEITYQFNDALLQLTINVGFDVNEVKTVDYPKVKSDYYENKIANGTTSLPGPFQHLKKGQNHFKLWKGLKPLAKYKMPAAPM